MIQLVMMIIVIFFSSKQPYFYKTQKFGKMKKVLFPTDFSDNAWNAISYGVQLYKDIACDFFVLHTYTPPFYRVDYALGGPVFSAVNDPEVDIVLENMDHTLKDLSKYYFNEKHRYYSRNAFNILTDEINKVSDKEQVDIIVMGTKGATGAKRILFGSNTVYTIRKAKIPILAVPDDYQYAEVKQLLFFTDYLRPYREDELELLKEIARLHNATITILYVSEGYDLTNGQLSNKESLKEALEGLTYEFKENTNTKETMTETLESYLKDSQYDMLVMMNRKHSFLERLLTRQQVEKIGFNLKIPFLVLRSNEAINW
ncbi:hypothetical protein P278_20690 [Zhouia amylolytica AD3]|uniref:UspA domain-containing protein n=2 Tax=Zhouia amylolytica TaxID=376730 RepID=W2UN60_9FLAO|nr:hypothetical protein P278_20690 [Zhouia amylolytica AD3]